MGGDWSEYLRVMGNLMQDQVEVEVSVELGKRTYSFFHI